MKQILLVAAFGMAGCLLVYVFLCLRVLYYRRLLRKEIRREQELKKRIELLNKIR